MIPRSFLGIAILALALSGCVDRGNWKPTAQLNAQSLTTQQTLHDAKVEGSAWPTDQWWRSYGDPQLDTLVDEALAGSPTLAIAQARLRAAQGQTVSARGALAPRAALDAL